jgi:hypothetical protein
MCKYGCLTPDKYLASGCLTCNCCPPPPPPPPTCGCNNDIVSGETCLNDTYYLTFPMSYNDTSAQITYNYGYVSFSFGYSLAVGSAIPTSNAIFNWISWYNQNNISVFTTAGNITSNGKCSTTKPDTTTYYNVGTAFGNVGPTSADNCYFWTYLCTDQIGNWGAQPGGTIITSYDIIDPPCPSSGPFNNS